MKKYSEEELVQFLTKDGMELDGYFVLGPGRTVCVVQFNLLFFNQICNDLLYLQVVDFLMARGRYFDGVDALRNAYPDVKT